MITKRIFAAILTAVYITAAFATKGTEAMASLVIIANIWFAASLFGKD